jgi:hypothetical protein
MEAIDWMKPRSGQSGFSRVERLGALLRRTILWLLARMFGGYQYRIREEVLRSRNRIARTLGVSGPHLETEHRVALPEAFGSSEVRVKLSVPIMPDDRVYAFAEHCTDQDGAATDRVIAVRTGGFAVSNDLGVTWRDISPKRMAKYPVVNVKALSTNEFLVQATEPGQPARRPNEITHLFVADARGELLHHSRIDGAHWHGLRAVDLSGGTLMYAEYTPNGSRLAPNAPPHKPSRVLRSRDFGRTWEPVFERPDVRHFHFLQARPGRAGEWWLSSGDDGDECRIWKSVDDGNSWIDQTAAFSETVQVRDVILSRRLFRLTDLTWEGDEIVWGCDDPLRSAFKRVAGRRIAVPGSRVFRGNPGTGNAPEILGLCGPEIRNVVELDDFYLFTTQASPFDDRGPPRVLLSRRAVPQSGANLLPLFDIERFSSKGGGFTYSRASRRARNGTFFSFRPTKLVFRSPIQILKWDVQFF